MASNPGARSEPFGFGPRQFWRWLMGVTSGPGAIMYRAMLFLALIGTGKGLITFFLAGKALSPPLLIAYGSLIGMFACAFIGVMAYSIERVFDAERRVQNFRELLVRLGWVGLYAVSFFISLSFSFAFWWDLLLADTVSKNDTNGRLELVTRQLNDLTGRIGQARTESQRLAQESRRLSQTESNEGNSCDNGSGRTFGPIASQRRSDADTVEGLANSIKSSDETVTADIAPLVNRARTAIANGGDKNLQTAQDNLRDAVDRINLVASQVRSKAVEFSSLADKYRDRDGATTTCRHEATRLAFTGIAQQLNGLTTIPSASLQVFKGERSVTEAVSRLWTPLGLTRLLPGTRIAPMTSGDFLPLVISLIVDFSLLILGVERGEKRSPGGRSQFRAEERARLSRAIEHMLRGNLHKVQIEFGGATYFVVPEYATGESDRGVSRAVILSFLRSFDRHFSPIVPFSLFSLPPLRWLMDLVASKRLGRASTSEDETAAADLLLEAWRGGSKFRWFRLNRKHAEQFLDHIGEFAEPEDGSGSGPIDPGGRRDLFLTRELPHRERRKRARQVAAEASDARLEQDFQIDRSAANAIRSSLAATANYEERLTIAEQRLMTARLEARIAETERQASEFEARARRARGMSTTPPAAAPAEPVVAKPRPEPRSEPEPAEPASAGTPEAPSPPEKAQDNPVVPSDTDIPPSAVGLEPQPGGGNARAATHDGTELPETAPDVQDQEGTKPPE